MKLTEGQKVWCYDFDGSKVKGTVHRNIGHEDVSEWYIKYEDGKEYAVLDETKIYKSEE